MEPTKKYSLWLDYIFSIEPTRTETTNIARLSKIILKLQEQEKFDLNDWLEILSMGYKIAQWVIKNSKVEITQVTQEKRILPSEMKKISRKKK